MKKIICVALVLMILLGCLTACNFTQNMSSTVTEEAEATPKVEKMMAALADDNTSEAKALLHPQVAETSDNAIAQMRDYLDGRKISAMELLSVNINTSTGTAGNTRQERIAYQVTLDDGAEIFLNAVYFSDNQGTGFASFQVVIGVV